MAVAPLNSTNTPPPWMVQPTPPGGRPGRGPNELDMNDFMHLLVVQMTHQDMFNPTTDTEFIAQMAQFAALQGIQNIQEHQLASYAVSYVGKHVTIAHVNNAGQIERVTGYVNSVTFFEGQPMVVVNVVTTAADGTTTNTPRSFPIFSVMEVRREAPPPEEDDDDAPTGASAAIAALSQGASKGGFDDEYRAGYANPPRTRTESFEGQPAIEGARYYNNVGEMWWRTHHPQSNQ